MTAAVANSPTTEKTAKVKPKRYRWKLLAGTHIEQIETGQYRDVRNPTTGDKIGQIALTSDKTFHAGETIETDLNLAKMYNSPGSQKVIPADDTPITIEGIDAEIARLQVERARIAAAEADETPAEDPMSSVKGYQELMLLDVKELRKVAEQSEVDVSKVKRDNSEKENLVKTILAAAAS